MILDELLRVISSRKAELPDGSYVASLFRKGTDEILRKIAEESTEVILASKASDRQQIIHEMADLWFHCMVLMADRGISHEDVLGELHKRFKAAPHR